MIETDYKGAIDGARKEGLSYSHCIKTRIVVGDVVRQNLAQRGVELHLIAVGQSIRSLPEYADRKEDEALRGVRERPGIYTACGEEAFAEPATGELGIDPCTTEFALAILRYGYDAKIRNRIAGEYRDAVKAGLRRNAPAGASPEQYWSELSAWYFGGHGMFLHAEDSFPAPGPQGLRQYDPQGYDLLKLLYSGMERPLAIEAIRARNVSKLAISQASNVSAQLQLVNNGPQTLRLFWIDPDGVTRSVGVLGPYRRAIEDTFLSDVWMVEDQRGVEIDRFVVDDPVSEVIHTILKWRHPSYFLRYGGQRTRQRYDDFVPPRHPLVAEVLQIVVQRGGYGDTCVPS